MAIYTVTVIPAQILYLHGNRTLRPQDTSAPQMPKCDPDRSVLRHSGTSTKFVLWPKCLVNPWRSSRTPNADCPICHHHILFSDGVLNDGVATVCWMRSDPGTRWCWTVAALPPVADVWVDQLLGRGCAPRKPTLTTMSYCFFDDKVAAVFVPPPLLLTHLSLPLRPSELRLFLPVTADDVVKDVQAIDPLDTSGVHVQALPWQTVHVWPVATWLLKNTDALALFLTHLFCWSLYITRHCPVSRFSSRKL